MLFADIDASPQGGPWSPRFQDGYHARQGAWGQANAVFVQGCGLPGRWGGGRQCTVLENGFGLGLNVLATWAAWTTDPARSERLHVMSIEAFPPSAAQLARWLPALVPEAEHVRVHRLLRLWPEPMLPGLHRLDLEPGRVSLTLAIGPAQRLVRELSLWADALYLDGFAPDRNPEMWEPALLRGLCRRLRGTGRLATWCAAGAVRRALQDAGMAVQRLPGYGGKRERIEGWRAADWRAAGEDLAPACPEQVLVIGAGVAGASVARALAVRGSRVTVLREAAHLPGVGPGGQGVNTGHLAAALTPVLSPDAANPRARLVRAGFLLASRLWAGLPGVRQAGTLHLGDAGLAGDLPPAFVQSVSAAEAAAVAAWPVAQAGLWFPKALQVSPPLLCQALLQHPGIDDRVAGVARLVRAGDCWTALDTQGRALGLAPMLVLAAGPATVSLLTQAGLEAPPLRALAGQISVLRHPGPACTVAGDGYVLPAGGGLTVLGSSYRYPPCSTALLEADHARNRERANRLLGCELRGELVGGWAGWRAVLPDRLPLVDAHPQAPGLWMVTGFGSRGLAWASVAAERLAAQLWGEPLPLESRLVQAIGWRRFLRSEDAVSSDLG